MISPFHFIYPINIFIIHTIFLYHHHYYYLLLIIFYKLLNLYILKSNLLLIIIFLIQITHKQFLLFFLYLIIIQIISYFIYSFNYVKNLSIHLMPIYSWDKSMIQIQSKSITILQNFNHLIFIFNFYYYLQINPSLWFLIYSLLTILSITSSFLEFNLNFNTYFFILIYTNFIPNLSQFFVKFIKP